MNEESLFAAALERPSAADRRAFLDAACAGDLGLRNRVEQLLAADGRASGILEEGLGATTVLAACRPTPRLAADQPFADRFRLVRKLGEGGMGEVWVADQTDPVQRTVALKMIRPGLDSDRLLARFEAERQALALMNHPNIAKVLDAGTAEGGRPYFVLELVEGVPITQFCADHRLSTRQGLELFVAVCAAVQHAHQKGVIHRDLKPSNILVATYDGKPVPKVIDFGVAKATGPRLADHSLSTEVGALIGTLEYMSPEQADPNNRDIDTRADVYALGVVLYELLTDGLPFTRQDLQAAPFAEMLRVIREVDPPKPSTRLAETRTAEIGTAAGRTNSRPRHPSSPRTPRLYELDWIVMKCLEKDRARRYESASALAADVQRYVADEPVLAGPPSAAYRVRKFVRRHRGPALAAALVLLVLVGGVIGTTVGLFRAREARQAEADRADAETRARERASAAEADALAKEGKTKTALEIASEVLAFLVDDLLGQAGTSSQAGRRFHPNPNLTLREALDRAAAMVGKRLASRPEVESTVRVNLGEAYRQLGQYDKAITQLRRAADLREQGLDPNDARVLDAVLRLAMAYREAGQPAIAIPLFERVRDGRMATLGPDDPATLHALSELALAYRDAGRRTDAMALHERVRDGRLRVLGPDDRATLATLHNIASMYLEANDLAEAIPRLEQVREAKVRVLDPRDIDTLPTLHNLATAYWMAQQLDKSVPLFEEVVDLYRQIHDEGHPMTLAAKANLGVNYRDSGKFDDAIRLLKEAHDAADKQPSLRWASRELLFAYARAGRTAEATAMARDQLAAARASLPADSAQLGDALAATGSVLVEAKAWNDAEPVLRDCLAIRQKKMPDDWRTFNTQSLLGAALLGQKNYTEAEPRLRDGYAGMRDRETHIPPNGKVRLTEAVERLVKLYEALDKPIDAAKWRKELEELHPRK